MEAKEFGKYLKELRKRRKLTIRQLDKYSDVSHSYISQMERGERGVPKPEILQKLSKPLGVSYQELMEKAGYITKENVIKMAIDEGLLKLDTGDDEFSKSISRLILEDTELFLEAINDYPEVKNDFFTHLFSNEDAWEHILTELLSRKKIPTEKAKIIFNELDSLSEDDVDDVIEFIKFRKSRKGRK